MSEQSCRIHSLADTTPSRRREGNVQTHWPNTSHTPGMNSPTRNPQREIRRTKDSANAIPLTGRGLTKPSYLRTQREGGRFSSQRASSIQSRESSRSNRVEPTIAHPNGYLETEHSAHLQGSKLNSRAIDPSVAPTSQANDSKSSDSNSSGVTEA